MRTPSLLLLLSSLHSGVLLPSETISTELRLSQLESGLDSTRSTLMKILRSVSILSKQHEVINEENVTGVVKSLQKKFDDLKDDLSSQLENKVKRADGGKFLTDESFEEVSRKVQKLQDLPNALMESVNRIKLDFPQTAITKEEFSSFQLTVARDLATVKVKVQYLTKLQTKVCEAFTITEKSHTRALSLLKRLVLSHLRLT